MTFAPSMTRRAEDDLSGYDNRKCQVRPAALLCQSGYACAAPSRKARHTEPGQMAQSSRDWDPTKAKPPQFSLAEVLLIITEAAVCLALLQIEGISVFSPILIAATCLLLHLSRWRVGMGIYFGIVAGCALMLLLAMAYFDKSFHNWVMWGFLVIPACTMYGGALNAVITRQKMYGFQFAILASPSLVIVVPLFWFVMEMFRSIGW